MKHTTFASAMVLAAAGIAFLAQPKRAIRSASSGLRRYIHSPPLLPSNFGKTAGIKTPVVESTGTGGGMKLFCGGVGAESPGRDKRIAPHEEG